MLALYFAPGSSSMAPHIALHEVGAAFEPRPISFWRKENRSAEYLALNPEGKVPTLLIDGRPLTEVAAILFYLARSFPAAGLLPDGAEAEAQVVSWMSFAASTLHPARRRGLEHAIPVWRVADQRLGARRWVMGDCYSIADIHVFRLYWRMSASLKPAPGAFPNLARHHERMLARPAVARTIRDEAAIGYELTAPPKEDVSSPRATP
jgi:glutathione S-transferase